MNDNGPPCPAQGVPRHEAQQQRLGRHPIREPPNARHVPERLYTLLQLEVAKIFLHHIGHRHPERGRKILHRHGSLFI
ncbi:MAG TPA: hypothetical protein VM715_19870 [Candidatus Acidoferrum sp.]|nr:hypothetical protein [Candidatus Acidoferrum sp.]